MHKNRSSLKKQKITSGVYLKKYVARQTCPSLEILGNRIIKQF